MIKLELTLEDVSSLLGMLGQMPYVHSAQLIDKIRTQALPQVPAENKEQNNAGQEGNA